MDPTLRSFLGMVSNTPFAQKAISTFGSTSKARAARLNKRMRADLRAHLAQLDARQQAAEHLRRQIAGVPLSADAGHAYNALTAAITAAEVCPVLGWNLVRMHTPLRTKPIRTRPAALSIDQADTLAHWLTPATPRPTHPEALKAFGALHQARPTQISRHIATCAAAAYHRILPTPLSSAHRETHCAVAVLQAHLTEGDILRYGPEPVPGAVPLPPHQGRKYLATFIHLSLWGHAVSAHQILAVLATANRALAEVGEAPTLTLEECLATAKA